MKFSFFQSKMSILWMAVLLAASFATPSFAQYGSSAPPPQPAASDKPAPPPKDAPKLNPKEEADYKALASLPDSDRSMADKKIQLSLQFLQKYPGSRYEESVMNQQVSAYFAKQDWTNLYAAADKAVAKDPDDVDALTIVGWVIPHLYNHDDPDAEKKLDKAESYEKHAIEIIPSLQKPENLSEDQFAEAKAGKLSQAHSGLGLVYFRLQDFPNSVKELQLATSGGGMPDPTDFYALGAGLLQLNRNSEAADAFAKCAEIPGGLQDRCKQMAAQAKGAK
jgi:tetratricopeptide (TPR) repeat protein